MDEDFIARRASRLAARAASGAHLTCRLLARRSLLPPRMAHRDTTGLTACYHLIEMLEAQLRAAQDLRQRLEQPMTAPDHHGPIVDGLCSALLEHAVATAQAVASLRETICAQTANSAAVIRGRKQDRLM